MSGQACSKCKKPVVRRVMQPLPGESRRVEWACKCEFTAGAAVEFGQRSAVHDAQIGAFSTPVRERQSHWRTGPDTFYR